MYINHNESNSTFTIASFDYKVNLPYAVLDSSNNFIKKIREKPVLGFNCNAGIYLINFDKILKLLNSNKKTDITEIIEKLLNHNEKINMFKINGNWIDIGNKYEFDRAQSLINNLK